MATNKILLITTGGTIASQLTEQGMSVNDTNPVAEHMVDICNEFAVTIEVVSPLNKNSENFQPADWFTLLACLKAQPLALFDAVLITHGTDTMHYSLAAVSLFAKNFALPICFTGSFYGFDHPKTDAVLNLRTAMKFVTSSSLDSGVYLAFKDGEKEQTASVYEAATVKPMRFDEQVFSSVYQRRVAQFDASENCLSHFSVEPLSYPLMELFHLPSGQTIRNAANQCLVMAFYPGVDLSTLQQLAVNKNCIILDLYHSGTADAEIIKEFLTWLPENKSVLMASFPGRCINHAYASTESMLAAGACIYQDLPIHYLYVYCVMSLCHSKSEVVDLSLLQSFQLINH